MTTSLSTDSATHQAAMAQGERDEAFHQTGDRGHKATTHVATAPQIAVQPMSLGDAYWGHVAFHVQFKGGNAPGCDNEALPAICAALTRALQSQLQGLVPGAQLGVRMVDYGWHEGLFHAELQRRIKAMALTADQGDEPPSLASPARCPPQSPAACGTS